MKPRSAEFGLVLTCAGWPRSAERNRATAEAAARVLDWARVLALAERHRVTGLLAASLKLAGVTAPEPHGAVLERRSREIVFEELTLASEVVQLQQALHERGVAALVMKGVATAMRGFGRLGLRSNRDIDLLVGEADVPAAAQHLAESGYVRVEPSGHLDDRALASWVRAHKDMVFHHPSRGVLVELHWRLFDNPELLSDLPLGSEALSLPGGRAVQTFDSDLSLLFSSLHGAEHAWSRLKWLADFQAVVAQLDPGEVERLYRIARTNKVHRALAQAFMLCGTLFGSDVPQRVVEDARRDIRIRWLVSMADRCVSVLEQGELEDTRFGPTLKNLSHYLISDGWRYWWAEFLYDVSDTSQTNLASSSFMSRLARPFLWGRARLLKRPRTLAYLMKQPAGEKPRDDSRAWRKRA